MNIFESLRAVGHDEGYEPTKFGKPTLAGPGSLEKVEVMKRRVELGQHLFHPSDERILASHESACVMSRTIKQSAKMKRVS